MWRRRHIVSALFIVSLLFVGIQIYLFSKHGSLNSNHSDSIDRFDNTEQVLQSNTELKIFQSPGFRPNKSSELLGNNAIRNRMSFDGDKRHILDTLQKFNDLNRDNGILLIFLQTSKDRVKGDDRDLSCSTFCDPRRLPFTFIMYYHPPQVTPTEIYRQNEFRVQEEKSLLPEIYTNSSFVTTHILLSHRNLGDVLFVHIVLLYTFIDDYRWFGRVSARDDLLLDGFVWSHPGIIEAIKTKSMTIDGIEFQIPQRGDSLLKTLHGSRYIECNHTRAALFCSLHHKEATQDEYSFISRARDIVSRATAVFHALELTYWLSSGTCLGWFRQCSIIPYSIDVDFGVWIRDYDDRIVPSFQNAGFKLQLIFGRKNDSYELSFYRGGIKVDIFFFYEEKDHMWNGGTQHDDGAKFKYKFPKFTSCWSTLLGLVVRIPCETESYIVANYGENWFTPVTTWGWRSSPNNVEANGAWREDEMDEVVQIFDVQMEDELVIDLHRQH